MAAKTAKKQKEIQRPFRRVVKFESQEEIDRIEAAFAKSTAKTMESFMRDVLLRALEKEKVA